MIYRISLFIYFLAVSLNIRAQGIYETKVDSVLGLMTLEEKIGQTNLLNGRNWLTGPLALSLEIRPKIKNGEAGAMLNVVDLDYKLMYQKTAVDSSRLGIPLMFGLDVIHGYRTILPIPLAWSCSWDPELIEKGARIAAMEATSIGHHWTFAPMVDIARDARWGRIMEGAGEDPYLGAVIARAQVRGFQGSNLEDISTMAACVKHYTGYGDAIAGKDYNSVDMSDVTLYNIHLPPFKAAVDENVATLMTAFHDLNGIPCTGNGYILNDILRKSWRFKGMVVSDWASISEIVVHGVATDKYEAAEMAMNASVDMDMQGLAYIDNLKRLIKDGKISMDQLDDAVRRILTVKFKLGLFDDPYSYFDQKRADTTLLHPDHLAFARKMGRESIVLLKNDEKVLPLRKEITSIAVIGPLADSKSNMNGNWAALGDSNDAVTVLDGIRAKVSDHTKVTCIKGCGFDDENRDQFQEAVDVAKDADAVVMVMGEYAFMSGEAHSRSFLGLPGVQQDLIKEIKKTGKPVILVLVNGRPLSLTWEDEHVESILETWFLGTQTGHAIADVLFGDYNPSGKLTVSFPRNVGQEPLYYNYNNTGRPPGGEYRRFTTQYIDVDHTPLYPFGYGLSYTSFAYSNLTISSSKMNSSEELVVMVTVKNTGEMEGQEIVQLYIRDKVASITRPVKELKDFRKIFLKPGEQQKVQFKINEDKLRFYNGEEFISEPGLFEIHVGPNSAETLQAEFMLEQ